MGASVHSASVLSTVKSAAVVASITASAMELFDRNGFDQTTVDEVALAAGISTRTFFRYFRTKEDVVVGTHAAFGPRVAEALKARPSSENIWISLRRSFDVLAERIIDDPASAAQSLRIINSAAILRAHRLEKHLLWSESLIPEVASRISDGDPVIASSLVQSALVCLDVALGQFAKVPDPEIIHDLLDKAFNANVRYCRKEIKTAATT